MTAFRAEPHPRTAPRTIHRSGLNPQLSELPPGNFFLLFQAEFFALCDATRCFLEQRKTPAQPQVLASLLGSEAQLTGAIFLALETARIAGYGNATASVVTKPTT
jgi:hypothetical protein